MPTTKQQRRRALELLEASIDGCTEAIMLAYGFKIELLIELINAGFATTSIERIVAGGAPDRSHPPADYRGWPAGAGEASMALILQTLSPDRRMGALANGQQVVKSFRYHLIDPRQFDIMQSGPGSKSSKQTGNLPGGM